MIYCRAERLTLHSPCGLFQKAKAVSAAAGHLGSHVLNRPGNYSTRSPADALVRPEASSDLSGAPKRQTRSERGALNNAVDDRAPNGRRAAEALLWPPDDAK
jgi:hypothetical protein